MYEPEGDFAALEQGDSLGLELPEVANYWIPTRSGVEFNLSRPTREMVTITDIAIALPRLNRFTGQTSQAYSVAAHTKLMYDFCPSKEVRPWVLLHDAAEAYIGDISSPLKALLESLAPSALKKIEAIIHDAVLSAFGLDPVDEPKDIVKMLDEAALMTERKYLVTETLSDWNVRNFPFDIDADAFRNQYVNLSETTLNLWLEKTLADLYNQHS